MTDAELVAFLEWAAERQGLRWEGLRNFRGTIKKRLARRMTGLGMSELGEYRARVERDPGEAATLEAMCRIPISRLYRDAVVWELLAREILPERARRAARDGRRAVRVWSAGCASGEEPYTMAIVWSVEVAPAHPGVTLDLLATDADEAMLARAERATYASGSVRELPPRLRERGMLAEDASFVVRSEIRAMVTFRREDLRRTMPDGPFDVVLCRNVLLTYIAERDQPAVLGRIGTRLLPGGALVIGARETMPSPLDALEPRGPGIYVARDGGA